MGSCVVRYTLFAFWGNIRRPSGKSRRDVHGWTTCKHTWKCAVILHWLREHFWLFLFKMLTKKHECSLETHASLHLCSELFPAIRLVLFNMGVQYRPIAPEVLWVFFWFHRILCVGRRRDRRLCNGSMSTVLQCYRLLCVWYRPFQMCRVMCSVASTRWVFHCR